ncbi:MAG: hypothetical protein QOI61_394 [Actinomycetota bacterium]
MATTMGWCHEFGPQIAETCEHPMTAHSDHCECTVCGTVCTGRFAGCGAVWARGPREVAVNAPRLRLEEAANDPFAAKPVAEERWQLPLGTNTTTSPVTMQVETASVVAEEPLPAPLAVVEEVIAFESPDVTARYAVAQLEELNSRVTELTEGASQRTEAALEKVYGELRRLHSLREIDLTEQAAGIFGAVQAGAAALAEFSQTVGEVTDDLRLILRDALKSIGGTDGLAAWVAASASDLKETRTELTASLGRIERDLTLLRRRSQAEAKSARIDDDQVNFIIEAVTEAVQASLGQGRRKK